MNDTANKARINLGILFGGRSCEHEVSVTSAKSILQALRRDQYQVHLIGIDKSGHWHLGSDIETLAATGCVEKIQADAGSPATVSISLHNRGNLIRLADSAISTSARRVMPVAEVPAVDVVFPVLHGTFGEDGTLQGVLEMAGLPYVGCGVTASALAMDKALAKKIFESASIPQAPYMVITLFQWQNGQHRVTDQIASRLGYAVFVKPANLGSSVGVSKARDTPALVRAIEHAFEFDNKIIVEQAMENCYEVECAILGNHAPRASLVGEIIPGAEFYNYETKYIDDKSRTRVPAPLDQRTTARVQALSIAAFKAIDGRGLARVDFFVERDTNAVILNEINTLPGFTPISMYPQLWAASGIPYPELIDKLIELAIENHQSKQRLKRVFQEIMAKPSIRQQ